VQRNSEDLGIPCMDAAISFSLAPLIISLAPLIISLAPLFVSLAPIIVSIAPIIVPLALVVVLLVRARNATMCILSDMILLSTSKVDVTF